MMDVDIAERLVALEERSESNAHRLDKLEHDHELLTRMATAIEVMATKQEVMVDRVETIDQKVTELERTPLRHWRTLIGYLATAVVSAGGLWLADHWMV
jgi:hypothetical protein